MFGISQASWQQGGTPAEDGLNDAGAEKIVIGCHRQNICLPEPARIISTIFDIAVMHNAFTQFLTGLVENGRALPVGFSEERNPERVPLFLKPVENLEKRLRILVVFPTVIPEDQGPILFRRQGVGT